MRTFLLGLLLGLLLVPVGLWIYMRSHPPAIAVGEYPPYPQRRLERRFDRAAWARIRREAPKSAPIEPSEPNIAIGAHLYRDQCAACHGLYGRPSSFAAHMSPAAPQLWQPVGDGSVGVSGRPVGETWWIIANGLRRTGMPGYRGTLNDTQIWQVTLLLSNADKPQPPGVLELLKQPLVTEPASGSEPPK